MICAATQACGGQQISFQNICICLIFYSKILRDRKPVVLEIKWIGKMDNTLP